MDKLAQLERQKKSAIAEGNKYQKMRSEVLDIAENGSKKELGIYAINKTIEMLNEEQE